MLTKKRLLSPERTAVGQLGLTAGRGTQHRGAAITSDSGLGVGENCGDVQASRTLDIHEKRPGALNKGLLLMLLGLGGWGWVQ